MVRASKSDSALLKVERATERIAEVSELLREKNPFSYVVETNTQSGERAMFAKQDRAVIDRVSVICGDAVHNLRAALDHAYWAIVSPFANSPREQRNVQFPFCERADRLDEAVKNRLAHRVSHTFFNALIALKPYSEDGGNALLTLIDSLDAPDKHRDLTPMANYTAFDAAELRHQVPDLPPNLGGSFKSVGMSRDVVWRVRSIHANDLGEIIPPTTCVFQRKLQVAVDIVFPIRALGNRAPVVPTLNALVDVAKETIGIIRAAV